MWELDYKESWVLKNWCFELWCWRSFLRVPWTARRSNQSILKISPGISLEGMMLKLKLQYFGHLMQRADSLEKPLMLGKIEGKRRGWQRMKGVNRGWQRMTEVGWHHQLLELTQTHVHWVMMPSNHLILSHPLLLPPLIFPSIRFFSIDSVLHIRWPKYWSFSFNISPSNEHPGLLSFRMDWLDLLAVHYLHINGKREDVH